ncbi:MULTISPECIES: hypothetical protein [Ornithinibacillus]|uniref:Uncharacterized protein n=2 Tax=Ornithinibacillus TaxID=484508 RepID=A0A923RGF6_9BACI|nr:MULTISPECIES: hypothetical protein [Ornithinibacillus]MBC5635588.1 hypothetical protein [Ornithinibacillus hominis]MBS3679199.1 hypothetical protein [Ornithinibacillus massiliensis]
MRHPYNKFIQGELVAIGLAIVCGLIALIQGVFLLIVICLYLLAASLVFDGLIAMNMRNPNHGVKQMLRAAILFLLTTFLFIFL